MGNAALNVSVRKRRTGYQYQVWRKAARGARIILASDFLPGDATKDERRALVEKLLIQANGKERGE